MSEDDPPAASAAGRTQSLATLGIAVFLCALVVWIFRQDVTYFLQNPEPLDLGVIGETDAARPIDNRYARVGGIADPRIKFAESGGKMYRYFILLGSKILVQQRTASATTGGEPRPFRYRGEGRLMKLSDLFKYDMLLAHFKTSLGLDLKDEGFLLVEGEKPKDALLYFAVVCASILAVVAAFVRHLARF